MIAPVERERTRIEAERRDGLQAAARALSDVELIALLGAPLWTAKLLAAAGLPANLVERARVLLHRDGAGDAAKLTVTEEGAAELARAALARVGRTDPLKARLDPQPILARLADALAAIERKPPVVTEWCGLLRHAPRGDGYTLGEHLLAEVEAACVDGALGRATVLIDAAAALARALGGSLVASVRVAGHRTSRAFRDARDREHLAAYVERADAMQAFDALLADGERWALHYVGVGGAGKSTLIRHVAVDVARDRDLQIARVDFDYLSPAYPARDPGQLVAHIIHELTLHVTRAEQDRYVTAVHEQLERVAGVAREVRDDDPVGPIGWPEFQDLLAVTATFIASLARPVLILDTCEELSKASLGDRIPSLDATFRLVEELHRRDQHNRGAAALRVIFAGRRLLPARPYLARHELRGMDDGEARALLARHLPAARQDDAALVAAILAACPEDDRVVGLAGGDERPRHSPFRLAQYGRWVTAEPDVPAERIAAGGTDAYLEQRIVKRMGRLEPYLPAVAVLRRFDRATFIAAIGAPDDASALFDELAGHEWITTSDVAGRGDVLAPRASIAEALETYLVRERPAAWRDACRRAAAALGPRLREPGAVRLSPELVDAALRALEPAAAAERWRDLEAAIDDDWRSAQRLTAFLLGEGRAAGDEHTLLGAAVRATHAGALVRLEPDLDVRALWSQVERAARHAAESEPPDAPIARTQTWVPSSYPPGSPEYAAAPGVLVDDVVDEGARPPPPLAWWLVQRAILGSVAARAWHDRGAFDRAVLVEQVVEVVAALAVHERQATLAAPLVAAIEAIVEHAERAAGAEPIDLAQLRRPLETIGDGALYLFARALIARLHALAHDRKATRAAIRSALAAVDASDGTAALGPIAAARRGPRLFDWRPPGDVPARVRLECLRLGFHRADLADLLDDLWRNPRDLSVSAAAAAVAERRRYLSALWLYRDRGQTEAGRRDRPGITTPLFTGAPPVPRCAVERRFGLSEIEESRVVTGRAPLTHRDAAMRSGVAIEAARFLVDRQLLADAGGTRSLAELRARAVVHMESPPELAEEDDILFSRVIERLPYQVIRDPFERGVMRQAAGLITWLAQQTRTAGSALERAQAAALAEEYVALSRITASPIAVDLPDVLGAIDAVHPDAHEALVRLALRAWARDHENEQPTVIFGMLERPRTPAQEALADLGAHAPRRLAQLAYDEAQVVGLRLPERAVPLNTLARAHFARCSDDVGRSAAALGLAIALRRVGRAVTVDDLDPPDERTFFTRRHVVLAPLRERIADPRDPLVQPFVRKPPRTGPYVTGPAPQTPGPAGGRPGPGHVGDTGQHVATQGGSQDTGKHVITHGGSHDTGKHVTTLGGSHDIGKYVSAPASPVRGLRWLAFGAAGVVVVTVAATVYFASDAPTDPDPAPAPQASGFPWWIVILGVVVAALGPLLAILLGVPARFRRWRQRRRLRALAPAARVRFVASSPDGIGRDRDQLHVTVQGYPIALPRPPKTTGPPASIAEPHPLGELAAQLTAALRGAPLDRRVTVPFPIEVDPRLDALAWDGSVIGHDALLEAALDPYRVVPGAVAIRPVAGAILAAPSTTRALATTLASRTVLHAIGRATHLGDGLRFDLGDDPFATEPLAPSDVLASESDESSLALVVLQGAPTPKNDSSEAARLEVRALRELAASLCSLGAPAVLVVPATDLPTTRRLILALRPILGTDPDRDAILAAARAARAILKSIATPDLHLEVTVYLATLPG